MRGLQVSRTFIRCLSTSCRRHVSLIMTSHAVCYEAAARIVCYDARPGLVRSFHASGSRGASEEFEKAKQRLGQLKEDPGNAVKLQLYALFKQSTVGACTGKRPGMTDFVGRAKWDAWNALGQISKEEAEKKYIDCINELVGAETPSAGSASAAVSEGDDVTLTTRDKMSIITFNRPTKKNAIKVEMYDTIVKHLEAVAKDKTTTLAVLTGAGDYYCSGNDLSNFTKINPTNIKQMAEASKDILQRFIEAFIDFPKPLIAVVNGPAVGIAVSTLGLCDAVLATERATFQTPFTMLGQSPEGCSSLTFPRAMGHAHACQMLLFNQKITAIEAQQRGIVSEVFPDASFQKDAWDRVTALARLPPNSLREAKRTMRGGERAMLKEVNRHECEILAERWQSDECMNAVMAFFKRKP